MDEKQKQTEVCFVSIRVFYVYELLLFHVYVFLQKVFAELMFACFLKSTSFG